MKTRCVEMYIGEGTDFGTWGTEYVDIPIDTPEDEIEEAGRNILRRNKQEFVFAGVYCIPPLEEQPY